MFKKLPLYAKILLGMAVGILAGIIAILTGANSLIFDYVKPFGTVFLNLLKLIAMPLIFASLVVGVSGLSDINKLSRIGIKTISLFLTTTVIAIVVGLVMVNIIKPGTYLKGDKKTEFIEKYSVDIERNKDFADDVKEKPKLQFLIDIVPENIVRAASDNTAMLQVIVFALIFGVAIVLTKHHKVQMVRDFVEGLNEVILKVVEIIMHFAPVGVMALMAGVIVDFAGDSIADSLHLLKSLGMYAVTVILGILFVALVVYPIFLKLFAGIGFKKFYSAMMPVQLVAFSTSSSAATLPVTMEHVERKLGVHNDISSFVLPVGVTINMDGTSMYQAIATVFIAEVFGIELTIVQMLTIVLMATLASIGTAGVPGAGIVMLIIVLNSVGLPLEGLALILAIDRPLDMIRSVLNVTGDAVVATVVAKSEGKLSVP